MATYFVVYNEQSSGERSLENAKWESVTVLDNPKVARVLKLEAATLAEAQRGVEHFQPGDVTGTPIVVTEAQWKES